MSLLLRTFRMAVHGARYGLLLGLIDLSVRIYNMHFEWFELYLALLLPILVLGALFPLLGLFISLLLFFLSRGKELLSDESAVSLIIFVLLLTLSGTGVVLSKSGETGEQSVFSLDLVAPMILIVAMITLLLRNIPLYLEFVRKAKSSRAVSAYQTIFVFCLGLIFISLPLDLYELNQIPETRPVKSTSEKRPNIVFITLDTVRADRLSIYDPSRKTSPNLLTYSKDAVVFEDAVSSSSWTLPGHAGMFTGKTLSEHKAHANHQVLEPHNETIAEHLLQAGYVTAGFVSGPYCKAKYGLAQGFQVYKDRLDFFEWNTTFDRFSIRRLLMAAVPQFWSRVFQADGERTAPEVNKDALDWIDKRDKDAPFFLFLNYYDAHDPYVLGEKYLHMFTQEKRPYAEVDAVLDSIYYGGPRRFEFESVPEDLRNYMLALYDSEIYYLDHHVGQLIEALRGRGLAENTIFVVTSDHGEEFFEHGGVLHRQTLFHEVLSVPLFIFGPGVSARRVEDLVGTRQLYATLGEIAGISSSKEDSLAPYLRGEVVKGGSTVLSELYGNRALGAVDIVSLTTSDWKLIEVSEERGRLAPGLFERTPDKEEQKSVYQNSDAKRQELMGEIKQKVGEDSWVLKD